MSLTGGKKKKGRGAHLYELNVGERRRRLNKDKGKIRLQQEKMKEEVIKNERPAIGKKEKNTGRGKEERDREELEGGYF